MSKHVVDFRKRVDNVTETLKLASDADTLRAISEEARLIRQEVARVATRPEHAKQAVLSLLDDFVEVFSVDLTSAMDEKTTIQVHR